MSSIAERIEDTEKILDYIVNVIKAISEIDLSIISVSKFEGSAIENIELIESDLQLPAIRVMYAGSTYGNEPVRNGVVKVYCIVDNVAEISSSAISARALGWHVVKHLDHNINGDALYTVVSDKMLYIL